MANNRTDFFSELGGFEVRVSRDRLGGMHLGVDAVPKNATILREAGISPEMQKYLIYGGAALIAFWMIRGRR